MDNKILSFFRQHIGQAPPDLAPPFNKWLNGILRKAEPGNVTMEFEVRKEMTNPAGMLHGGMHAAMIDEVMGMSVASINDQVFYTTLNISIDYLETARLGETVFVEAMVVRNGKNIINVVCEMKDQKGKLLSKGSSNLFNTQIPLNI